MMGLVMYVITVLLCQTVHFLVPAVLHQVMPEPTAPVMGSVLLAARQAAIAI